MLRYVRVRHSFPSCAHPLQHTSPDDLQERLQDWKWEGNTRPRPKQTTASTDVAVSVNVCKTRHICLACVDTLSSVQHCAPKPARSVQFVKLSAAEQESINVTGLHIAGNHLFLLLLRILWASSKCQLCIQLDGAGLFKTKTYRLHRSNLCTPSLSTEDQCICNASDNSNSIIFGAATLSTFCSFSSFCVTLLHMHGCASFWALTDWWDCLERWIVLTVVKNSFAVQYPECLLHYIEKANVDFNGFSFLISKS